MPDAYRVKQDVSIPRVVATSGEGASAIIETEGVNYPGGSYVLADHMTPRDRERADKGELDEFLEPVSLDEARQGQQAEGDFGIFIAEHEAEAHALESYGHVVVPPDQALEAQSHSAQWAKDYQQAVREHGLDRRPAQEAMSQPRERVPDELLLGAETRAGQPHDRGPEGYNEQRQNAEGEQAEGDTDNPEAQTLRQRPGSTESVVADREEEK